MDAGGDADNAVLREWGRDLLAAITEHGPRPTAALGLLLTRAELTDTDRAAALVARAWDRFRAGGAGRRALRPRAGHRRGPAQRSAHQGRAVILRSLGRYEEALADLDRAEELNPGLPGTEGERGEVYRATGRYEEAVACYGRALALDPDYAWAHGSRALALEALGRLPEARADLDRALELDPGYGWARERRERLGARAGQ
ncbi:tetratricopeptide repeat protein [Streptomyces rubiginosohelvolus]